MYFPLLKLHGWRKRSAAQPQTICSEFPQIFMNRIRSRAEFGLANEKRHTDSRYAKKETSPEEGLVAYLNPTA